MKIGILTYHRSHNYGALLQAIALRDFLSSKGYDVSIIDYWPDYHKDMYRMLDFQFLKRASVPQRIKYLLKKSPLIFKRRKRNRNFKTFIRNFIEPSLSPYSPDQHFDIIIYGSDQIWRKQFGMGNIFNPVYFGVNVLDTEKHVAFSASMGNINLSGEDKNFIVSSLSQFSALAVRESDLKQMLESIGIENIRLTVDPTFLLSEQQWIQKFNLNKKGRITEKPYLLYFNLMERCFDLKKIKSFAQKKGLELIILESDARHIFTNKGIIETVDPVEFLNLIRNADMVLTSSFHGLAFSIIFKKNFYASFTVNSGRAKSLLEQLNLSDRLLSPGDAIPDDNNFINYDMVSEKLNPIIEKSEKYLCEAVN